MARQDYVTGLLTIHERPKYSNDEFLPIKKFTEAEP